MKEIILVLATYILGTSVHSVAAFPELSTIECGRDGEDANCNTYDKMGEGQKAKCILRMIRDVRNPFDT